MGLVEFPRPLLLQKEVCNGSLAVPPIGCRWVSPRTICRGSILPISKKYCSQFSCFNREQFLFSRLFFSLFLRGIYIDQYLHANFLICINILISLLVILKCKVFCHERL